MTLEEKAKAYDEAIKIARCWLNDPQTIEDCGYTIEDAIQNIFPVLKESEDERIRKWLVNYFGSIKTVWIHMDITCEQILAWLEKQKDASKAIETIDRIDKYIDEHLANAHDMKDSNPDKKYYRGWDDALGKMAGILQDVYSNEKQKDSLHISETCKENADSFTDDERIRKALIWHLKAGEDFVSNGVTKEECLAYLEKQKDCIIVPKSHFDPVGELGVDGMKILEKEKEQNEELIYRLNGLMQEYIEEGADEDEKEHRLKCYKLFWDALEDTSYFEQKEQKHPNGCFTCDEYKKGYEVGRSNGFTAGYNKAIKEQKPISQEDFDAAKHEALWNEQKPNIELIQQSWYMEGYHDREFGKEPKWIIKTGEGGPRHEENPKYGEMLAEQKPAEWEDIKDKVNVPYCSSEQEWSEEDEKMIDTIVSVLGQYIDYKAVSGTGSGYATPRYSKEIAWLKSLRPQPRQEWNEDDETYLSQAIETLEHENYSILAEKLKSLRPTKDCNGCPKHLEGYISGRSDAESKLLEMYGILLMPDGELRMKPRWKPSEEQMEALLWCTAHLGGADRRVLAELYEHLKIYSK